MTQPKLTKWYRVKAFYPRRLGWYDYRGEGIGTVRAFWTGKDWVQRVSLGHITKLFPLRNDEWRGLAEGPNGR